MKKLYTLTVFPNYSGVLDLCIIVILAGQEHSPNKYLKLTQNIVSHKFSVNSTLPTNAGQANADPAIAILDKFSGSFWPNLSASSPPKMQEAMPPATICTENMKAS